MDLHRISSGLQELWENKPAAVILFTFGFLMFLYLVIDTWRHKRRRRRSRGPPRP